MEDLTWVLVLRMFIPLVEPVQPHNWEVFEWSPEFWARMEPQPKGKTTPTKQGNTRQQADAANPVSLAQQDTDAIGVFEL